MPRYSLGALAVIVFTSVPLFAGPITLTSSFVQGAVGDSGTPGIPSTTVCGDSTGAGSLSTSCSGSLAVSPSGTGFFSGTAAASASTLAALTLGSATSLDVWRVNDDYFGTFPRYVASATTTARVDDVVTVLVVLVTRAEVSCTYSRSRWKPDGERGPLYARWVCANRRR